MRARWVVVLLVAAAACSIYGEDGHDTPAPTLPVVEPTADGSTLETSDAASSDEAPAPLDGGGGVEPADTSTPLDATKDTSAPTLPDLVVFLTSMTYTGKFGALSPESVADQHCQDAADTAGILYYPRKFKAWFGGPNGNVKNRILSKVTGRRYVRSDKKVVSDDAGNMLTEPLKVLIELDQNGSPWTGFPEVWTGTDPNGQTSSDICGSWNTDSANTKGNANSLSLTAGWGAGGAFPCNEQRHLYCFEVP